MTAEVGTAWVATKRGATAADLGREERAAGAGGRLAEAEGLRRDSSAELRRIKRRFRPQGQQSERTEVFPFRCGPSSAFAFPHSEQTQVESLADGGERNGESTDEWGVDRVGLAEEEDALCGCGGSPAPMEGSVEAVCPCLPLLVGHAAVVDVVSPESGEE